VTISNKTGNRVEELPISGHFPRAASDQGPRLAKSQSSTVVHRIQPLGGYHQFDFCSGQILGSVNGFLAQMKIKDECVFSTLEDQSGAQRPRSFIWWSSSPSVLLICGFNTARQRRPWNVARIGGSVGAAQPCACRIYRERQEREAEQVVAQRFVWEDDGGDIAHHEIADLDQCPAGPAPHVRCHSRF
jgi:hypothetical protein